MICTADQKVKNKVSSVITDMSLDKEKIAALAKPRLETYNDINEIIDFFQEVPEYDKALYTHKRMKTNPENSG